MGQSSWCFGTGGIDFEKYSPLRTLAVTPLDRKKPLVPNLYALQMIEVVADYGVSREALLAGLDISDDVLRDPGARMSIEQYEELAKRGILLAGEDAAGLGFEFGLRKGITILGAPGLGMLSQITVREAIEFGIEFSKLVVPVIKLQFWVEDDFAVLDVSNDEPIDPLLYRYVYDDILACIGSVFRFVRGEAADDIELWFNYPQPDYYAQYRDRLPTCRFDMGANQVCFPAAVLDQRLPSGNVVTARLASTQCRRELAVLAEIDDLPARVRTMLINQDNRYPDLEALSTKLCMSARTLKRKLQQHGTSFQSILDEVRRNEAFRLLRDLSVTVEQVATRVGYSDPSTFTLYFRKWTGMTPTAYREQQAQTQPTIITRRF